MREIINRLTLSNGSLTVLFFLFSLAYLILAMHLPVYLITQAGHDDARADAALRVSRRQPSERRREDRGRV